MAVLALAGSTLLEARDQRRPPGELVELPDGRMLHLQIAGGEHTGPTIVLDAGQGMFSPAFAWLQDALALHATVVAYDRPGDGWSTPADRPVDAAATADDLHNALTSHGLDGPYLLVGHSLGAFYAHTFAARQIITVAAAARYWQAAGAEIDAFSTLAAAPPDGFGDVPVMVIGAERDVPDGPKVRAVLDELNRELVSRVPRSTHHVIEGADHLTLLTVEAHAREVSELIVTLLPANDVP